MVRARSGFCDAEGFALVVGASGLVTTLVVQLEYEGTSPVRFLRCRRGALDVDTSGGTTLVVEVLEVDAKWVNSERWPRTPTGCKSVPPQVCSRHVRRKQGGRLSREGHTLLRNLAASWLLPG